MKENSAQKTGRFARYILTGAILVRVLITTDWSVALSLSLITLALEIQWYNNEHA